MNPAVRWTEVVYKCKCMKEEASVHVHERGRVEGTGDFMRRVQDAISEDHRQRNALCMSEGCEYVKIPHKEGRPIGEAEGGTA